MSPGPGRRSPALGSSEPRALRVALRGGNGRMGKSSVDQSRGWRNAG